MRLRIMAVFIAAAALLVVPALASATQPEKQWVCHGTGSESNPYVLIHVPTNVGAHAGHLADSRDVLAADQEEPSCPGGPDQPPVDDPLSGSLDEFETIAAQCAENEFGVNGFTVTRTLFEDGEEVSSEIVFTQAAVCVPLGAGPAGAPGDDGAPGTDGSDGSNGATGKPGSDGSDGQDLAACSTNRVAHLRIVRSRGDKVRKLSIDFEGHKLTIKNGLLKKKSKHVWKATVDMRGYPAGVYGVRVRARVNGHLFRHVHLYRSCPSQFTTGSLNNKRYVVLGSDAQNEAGSNR